MLVWDEADVTACLETAPKVDKHGTYYAFLVASDGLRLRIRIWPYKSNVRVSLNRDGIADPIFDADLQDCSGVRYVNEKYDEYLEFGAPKLSQARYDGEGLMPFGIRVSVKPHISITAFMEKTAI